jgi:hypothetical protein
MPPTRGARASKNAITWPQRSCFLFDLLGPVNAVNLEHVLVDIQTNRGDLHVDGSSEVIRLRRTTLWNQALSTTSRGDLNRCSKRPATR